MKSITMVSRSLTNLFLVAVALAVIILYAANNNRHAHTQPPISNSTSSTTPTDHPQEQISCIESWRKLIIGCEDYLRDESDTDPAEYCCPAMRSVARNMPECVCEIYYVATLFVNPNIDPLKPLAVIDDCNIPPNPRMPDCKALIPGKNYSAPAAASSPSPWTYRAWVCVLLHLSLVFFSSVIVLWIR